MFAGSICDSERKFRKEFGPAGLPASKNFSTHKVLEGIMVRKDFEGFKKGKKV